MDAPPQVIMTLLGWQMTDQFLFTFLWFGGLVLLGWAVIHKVREDDGSGVS